MIREWLARVARRGRSWLNDSARETYGLASLLVSLGRRRRTYVKERWAGEIDLAAAARVAVFNHFDRRGTVAPFVEYYVRKLHDAGYAILFVSNSPRLAPAAIERLTPICGAILRRDNVGRDFGAYKDGLQAIPRLERLDSLVLVNDSVYGPFHDLGVLIDRMNLAEADVWGITDSWERRFHLQSFFLVFGPAALASAAFDRFWRGVHYIQAKRWIIDRYEVGLTQALMAGGLRCRALFPYRAAAKLLGPRARTARRRDTLSITERRFLRNVSAMIDSGNPFNPTHFFWEILISRMGCPFLKRELLRDNPGGIPGLQRWEQVVRSVSKYDTDLIVRDLETSLRGRIV